MMQYNTWQLITICNDMIQNRTVGLKQCDTTLMQYLSLFAVILVEFIFLLVFVVIKAIGTLARQLKYRNHNLKTRGIY